jgi:hypothetical protein
VSVARVPARTHGQGQAGHRERGLGDLRERSVGLGDRDQGADRQARLAHRRRQLAGVCPRSGVPPLPISIEHAERAGQLLIDHRDPFDRMLIAQAQAENLHLVSSETLFDAAGVRRLW